MPRDACEKYATPLVAAIYANDVAAVREALTGGDNPRILIDGETALHTAVRHASPEVAEALIEGGALEWVTDARGRTPLHIARESERPERDRFVELLDRTLVKDAAFRSAVDAIHRGDVAALETLLDREPRLLRERNLGPEAYRKRRRADYFRDPMLFWYVANNPTTIEVMPKNVAAIAQTMIARGVEKRDLDYALALTMTSGPAIEQGRLRDLMRVLRAAGATPGKDAILAAAAHGLYEPLHVLVEDGFPIDAHLAATFGDTAKLQKLLSVGSRELIDEAFGLAVINRHVDAARIALRAGANVDGFIPIHSHGTALHQAAASDDAATIAFLLAEGARTDIRDTLWDGTPLDWARFAKNRAAEAALEKHEREVGTSAP